MSIKERPIIFNAESVRAILEGRKTQTRRVVKPQPDGVRYHLRMVYHNDHPEFVDDDYLYSVLCPFGKVGDHLWVRETWAPMCKMADPWCWCDTEEERERHHYIEYRADTNTPYPGDWPGGDEDSEGRPVWKSPMFMPRLHSRILLEVTGVRVHRLNEMTEHEWGERDAMAEGFPVGGESLWGCAADWYREIWDSINAKRGYPWESNPFVWAVAFKKVTP
jgi:hypothetical protein